VEWIDQGSLANYSFDFDASGFVTLNYNNGTSSPQHLWHSDGTNFRFGLPYRDRLRDLRLDRLIYAGLSLIRRRTVMDTSGEFTIVSATNNEIRWRSVHSGKLTVLRRIPD
jgi:hypothetical protein